MKINVQTKAGPSRSFLQITLRACNQGIIFLLDLFSVECTNNTYGQDCRQACGSCIKLEQCDVVNGSCSNGCDAGFMGDKCFTGKRHSHQLGILNLGFEI